MVDVADFGRVAVLYGGKSAERAVTRVSMPMALMPTKRWLSNC